MKNTANGGNNRAPQYRTKESNVAVQRRGSANPSLASIVAPYSPCANSSFVSSWGVFRIPVRSKWMLGRANFPPSSRGVALLDVRMHLCRARKGLPERTQKDRRERRQTKHHRFPLPRLLAPPRARMRSDVNRDETSPAARRRTRLQRDDDSASQFFLFESLGL